MAPPRPVEIRRCERTSASRAEALLDKEAMVTSCWLCVGDTAPWPSAFTIATGTSDPAPQGPAPTTVEKALKDAAESSFLLAIVFGQAAGCGPDDAIDFVVHLCLQGEQRENFALEGSRKDAESARGRRTR